VGSLGLRPDDERPRPSELFVRYLAVMGVAGWGSLPGVTFLSASESASHSLGGRPGVPDGGSLRGGRPWGWSSEGIGRRKTRRWITFQTKRC
jgi:hypothetical protein